MENRMMVHLLHLAVTFKVYIYTVHVRSNFAWAHTRVSVDAINGGPHGLRIEIVAKGMYGNMYKPHESFDTAMMQQ